MSSFGRPTAEDFLFNHCVRRAGHASGTQSGKTRDQTERCSNITITITFFKIPDIFLEKEAPAIILPPNNKPGAA